MADPLNFTPAEQLARQKSRKLSAALAVTMLIGGALGALFIFIRTGKVNPTEHPVAGALVIALFVAATLVAGLRMGRYTDEFGHAQMQWAAGLAFTLFAYGVPVWIGLWRLGWLPEPQLIQVYGATIFTMLGAMLLRFLRP